MSQWAGLGVVHTTRPLSQSTAITSASRPPGARIARPPTISGHCPAYHCGTFVPYSVTRSMPHFFWPVIASAQITWHLGPIATTYLSLTAGTVRLKPWLGLTLTG